MMIKTSLASKPCEYVVNMQNKKIKLSKLITKCIAEGVVMFNVKFLSN